MKSLSLKVMTLLMAALVLSASGCSNENEMSSTEGTVKGYYKALNQYNDKKMLDYTDPREVSKFDRLAAFVLRNMRKSGIKITFTDLKTTLVSEKEILVWKGDKWGSRKEATLEVSFKVNGENIQGTEKLVLLDNKWYIEEVELDLFTHYMNEARRRRLRR